MCFYVTSLSYFFFASYDFVLNIHNFNKVSIFSSIAQLISLQKNDSISTENNNRDFGWLFGVCLHRIHVSYWFFAKQLLEFEMKIFMGKRASIHIFRFTAATTRRFITTSYRFENIFVFCSLPINSFLSSSCLRIGDDITEMRLNMLKYAAPHIWCLETRIQDSLLR